MTEPAPDPPGDLSVDDYGRSWTDDEAALLGRWSQGDLLDGPHLAWAEPSTDAYVAPVLVDTTAEAADRALRNWQVSRSDIPFRWAAITSQTCDIGAAPPGSRHPFVQVSPVISLEGWSENSITTIKKHGRVDLVALTAPPSPGDWAVDLRVSLPVTKEALLAGVPRPGFATENDALAFAERIAVKFYRPALHSSLSEKLPDSLAAHMRSVRKQKPEWWQKLDEIRVRVLDGTRLRPMRVQLIFVERVPLDAEEREVWRSWAKAFGKEMASTAGSEMDPVLFQTLDELPSRLYVESVPVRESVSPR
ncbi:hypothetical protein EV189_0381 [Motilibacter rhizosphaerae]|uniref:Uncharacterized protein n=1 Tax=Motilibacter rhizosphaerae TaxID=598652 RepID=A0A4Q7NVD7_9ACTN|nr:hypothetical protein [Motilibacter rhizosphaerae]RZS91147.1 hypothetical protein EV189_0381 [Motilibacter rhizosphaerae]